MASNTVAEKAEAMAEAVLAWFGGLPPGHRHYLAYMYWICTADDTRYLFMEPEQCAREFTAYLGRHDFPVRKLCHMLGLKEVLDYIMGNNAAIERAFDNPAMKMALDQIRASDNIINFSPAKWRQSVKTWGILKARLEQILAPPDPGES